MTSRPASRIGSRRQRRAGHDALYGREGWLSHRGVLSRRTVGHPRRPTGTLSRRPALGGSDRPERNGAAAGGTRRPPEGRRQRGLRAVARGRTCLGAAPRPHSKGAFVAMRTDWSKRGPDDAALANRDAAGVYHYPGWSLEVLKLLYEQRGITASGHETTDTDPGFRPPRTTTRSSRTSCRPTTTRSNCWPTSTRCPKPAASSSSVSPSRATARAFRPA